MGTCGQPFPILLLPPHPCPLSSPFLLSVPWESRLQAEELLLLFFLLQFALNALGAAGGLPLIAVVTPHQAELGLPEGVREELRHPPG